jgi:hypothetical protein
VTKTIDELTEPTWSWYSGDGETYPSEYDSRIDALAAAIDYDDSHIAFASKKPIRFSDYFDANDFITSIEDDEVADVVDEDGDSTIDLSPEVIADLEAGIREAIDAWQVRHQLAPEPVHFDECEEERVVRD